MNAHVAEKSMTAKTAGLRTARTSYPGVARFGIPWRLYRISSAFFRMVLEMIGLAIITFMVATLLAEAYKPVAFDSPWIAVPVGLTTLAVVGNFLFKAIYYGTCRLEEGRFTISSRGRVKSRRVRDSWWNGNTRTTMVYTAFSTLFKTRETGNHEFELSEYEELTPGDFVWLRLYRGRVENQIGDYDIINLGTTKDPSQTVGAWLILLALIAGATWLLFTLNGGHALESLLDNILP